MREVCLCALTLLASLYPLAAKPRINEKNGVTTLATVATPATLARGSVFAISGAELGPAEAAAAEIPYPQELAGVTVALTAASDGAVYYAYLLSVAENRITAIVPSTAPAGNYALAVSSGGETSNPSKVTVADANFGLITNTGAPGGMAQARILISEAEPASLTYANGATPGATLEFSAAGLGAIDGPDNELPAELNRIEGAVLLIGGQEAPVTYIGRDPARPGYDKVVVTLPASDLPLNCASMFQLRLGETTTSTFSMPIVGEPGAACENSVGISPEGLQTLSSGGSVILGGMTLARVLASVKSGNLAYESKVDQFSGGFVAYTAQAVSDMLARSQFLRDALSVNSCTVYEPLPGSGGEYVDAGGSLTIEGPPWTLQIPRNQASPNVYGLQLSSEFTGITVPPQPGQLNSPFVPGHYKLAGPGGAVVGPFSVEIDVSEQFQWTNGVGLDKVDRQQDLVLTWTGGGPEDTVQASGTVRGFAPEDTSRVVDRVFQCAAPASAGQIVVPASILQQMPIVTSIAAGGPGSTFYGSLAIAHTSPQINSIVFRAPLVSGGSTEASAFVFGYTYARAPVLFP